MSYLGDIIIYSECEDEHENHIEEVLRRLTEAGIVHNKSKYLFRKQETMILGYIVGNGIIKPDEEKTKALNNYKKPETIKEVRAFLGW